MRKKTRRSRRAFLKSASGGAAMVAAGSLLGRMHFVAAAVQPHGSKIEIIYDGYGVPHIFADTLADAVYGQAFCHAEDNLELILDTIAASRGQSARLIGFSRFESDLMVRAFELAKASRQGYEALVPEQRAIVDAYAAGINRYLADHAEKRPDWLQSVSGFDIVALTKLRELQEAMAVGQADLAGASQGSRERDQASPEDQGGASNMWALRPSRTSDGSVVLLSDPHLPWDGAMKWHESHLVVGDRWIYGATFPGAPGVGIGFTQDIAWGLTNNGADLADVYRIVLDSNNSDRYRFDGGWRDILTRRFSVEVRQPDGSVRSVERKVRFTHHGPILKEDAAAHVAFAVRVAGLDAPASTLSWIGNFNATNLKQFETALDDSHINKWNCIAADRHGNIGYYYFTATHRRSDDYRWNAPVDGSTSATEWGPALSWRDLPHTANPPSGYLVNCNNNAYTVTRDCPLKPQDYPKHLLSQSTVLSLSTRAYRATELIEARAQHDAQSIMAIATDIKALTAQPLLDLILDADKQVGASVPDPDQHRRKAIAALRNWDGMATTDNLALPILSSFLEAAQKESVAAKRTKRRGAGRPSTVGIPQMSPREVLATLDAGLTLLRERWGTKPVTWGMVHMIQRGGRQLPMPGAGPDRGADPFTCLFMAGAKKMTDGQFHCENGSSWMQLVRFVGGKAVAQTILPFGNSNTPTSPHYADQMPLFAARKLKQALLSRVDIEAATERRVELTSRP